MKRTKTDIPSVVDELRDAYNLFIEVMENPLKMGYIVRLSKTKPMSKELINFYLFDKKNYLDWKIKDLTEEILKIIDID